MMILRKSFILLSLFLLMGYSSFSQELKCNIQVSAQKIQGTNRQVFNTLQSEMYEFMNNRKWTNHVFAPEERIECNILFNITERISTDEFKGTIQIQSRRPVYNTSYNTVMLNYLDNDLHFQYVEYEPLEFNESEHLSNLTSILAFYAYIIIGLDYDSFSFEGGTPFFKKAETIVNNAKNAPEQGWKSYESDDNRYWLIKNILNDQFSPIREFFYQYHRMGLDKMYDDQVESRSTISESLLLLREVYRDKPSLHMPYYDLVFDAKSDEFIKIFSEANPQEKTRVVNILNEIDPANSSKYQGIIKGD